MEYNANNVFAKIIRGEIPCEKIYEDDYALAFYDIAPKAKVRSRNITKHGTEWIVEMQTKDEAGLVKAISEIGGVVSVNLMTHDGEVRF